MSGACPGTSPQTGLSHCALGPFLLGKQKKTSVSSGSIFAELSLLAVIGAASAELKWTNDWSVAGH